MHEDTKQGRKMGKALKATNLTPERFGFIGKLDKTGA
jgi:hypothetical protein